jgi:hypothetical protein
MTIVNISKKSLKTVKEHQPVLFYYRKKLYALTAFSTIAFHEVVGRPINWLS